MEQKEDILTFDSHGDSSPAPPAAGSSLRSPPQAPLLDHQGRADATYPWVCRRFPCVCVCVCVRGTLVPGTTGRVGSSAPNLPVPLT